MKKKLFAFWRYDLFPFVCCGTITDMNDSCGTVETENYGKGSWFKPFLIVTETQGIKMRSAIAELTIARRTELRAVEKKYADELKKIITIPKNS